MYGIKKSKKWSSIFIKSLIVVSVFIYGGTVLYGLFTLDGKGTGWFLLLDLMPKSPVIFLAALFLFYFLELVREQNETTDVEKGAAAEDDVLSSEKSEEESEEESEEDRR